MATAIWLLENGPKTITKRHPDRFLAFFRLFSHFFDFLFFSLVFALFGLSVSDRFWPSVFVLFRTIRLLPFSGCHLDFPKDRSFSTKTYFLLSSQASSLAIKYQEEGAALPSLAPLLRAECTMHTIATQRTPPF